MKVTAFLGTMFASGLSFSLRTARPMVGRRTFSKTTALLANPTATFQTSMGTFKVNHRIACSAWVVLTSVYFSRQKSSSTKCQ